MRFIHCETRQRHLLEEPPEALGGEALRGDVEERELASPEGVLRRSPLAGGGERVKGGRGDAFALELVDLVLHEGNQGRDDEGRARQEQRRQLVPD